MAEEEREEGKGREGSGEKGKRCGGKGRERRGDAP